MDSGRLGEQEERCHISRVERKHIPSKSLLLDARYFGPIKGDYGYGGHLTGSGQRLSHGALVLFEIFCLVEHDGYTWFRDDSC